MGLIVDSPWLTVVVVPVVVVCLALGIPLLPTALIAVVAVLSALLVTYYYWREENEARGP